MEGMVVSAVLKVAVAKLASAVGHQVMMQWKLKDNLEEMKDALESMAAVLNDAERRSIREESVLLWLKRLKNAAYDISDMLDDFQDGKRTGLLSYVPIAAKNIGLPKRIKKMKQQLRKIQEDHEQFKFSLDSGGTIEQQIIDQRETISAVNEDDVVGREEEKKNIIQLLLERNSKEETIIVPIHGLGGIGKTTLARLVFNETHFKEYDHRVWVYVSQVLDLKKIGNTIISRVSKQGNHDLNDLESIYQRLKELLNGQKCLIVLDDLWEEKGTELEKLKTMLNVGKAGSKIDVIVTTRKEEIAQNIGTGEPYHLKPLDDTMCWGIIKKRCNFESRPDKEQLEQIGQDIANKCAGIALAAQALGYMLSGMNPEEWSAMRDNYIWSESSSGDTSFPLPLPSLMLSYQSMPSYLKLCFAYCAIFPKGHNIRKYDLIHQWIALDFIEPSKTFSAIQLGEKYVRQLLGMSFLRHSYLSSTSQRLAKFTMHDLVHDLARSVMGDELLVYDAKKESNSSRNKYCRCAFLTNYSGPAIFPAKVRALRFLDCWDLELRNDAFSFAKYLRVLDLSGCPFSKLPKCVTQLSRLQYLNLQGSGQISALPESIGKIEHLMHLDLKGCSRLVELPESLGNLKSLVHFELSDCSGVQGMPKAFSSLTKLQYLNFSWCHNLEKLPEDIGSLTELQYLNLQYCDKLGELPESFQKLHNLVHLDLSQCCGVKRIPGALGGLTKLQYLNFSRCTSLKKLPEDIGSLTELQYLNLKDCGKLGELPESFQKLHNLVHLDLSRCCGVKRIPGALGGLTKLQYLNFSRCSNLEKLPEDIGSLTELQYLNSQNCGKLGELPESFQKLHNLVHLDLSRCCGVKRIPGALGGLTKLQYLNLEGTLPSNESGRYVECIGALTNTEHLDLSWNSGINYLPESFGNLKRLHTLDISCCSRLYFIPESLGNLKRLYTLDISHCSRLDSIPESLGNLESLHTLDISHCSRLNSIPESIGAIRTLKFIKVEPCSNQLKVHMTHSPLLSKFVKLACLMVHANGNLHLLDHVNNAELEICSLEYVRFLEEARRVKLFEKQNLSRLTFDWALDACRLLEDKDVLEELVPPRGLNHLGLRGYSSIDLPTWLMGIISSPRYLDVSHHLPNLVKITLKNLPRCTNLPPLGQLPNLNELHLRRLRSITKIGEDLCGGGRAFRRLSTFWLEHMEQLEEWSTTYNGVEFMFPNLKTLWTFGCPLLRLKPCPPIFSDWIIRSSDKVISSWGEGSHISASSSTPASMLKVEYSKVPMDKWRLLHHIPTLQELELWHCDYLASLPESMQYLVSLRSLKLYYCSNISVLPEWMGDVTSLESLTIFGCQSLKSLPQCVQQLTKLKELEIRCNYELKKWCESEENKIKLAHIKTISIDGPVRDSNLPEDNSVSLQLFMVSDVNTCSKLHQLEDVNLKKLKISCLENVRSLEEARKIKLLERQSLSKLTLEWTWDEDRFLEDKDVLGELVPPRGLQHLELDGYSSISFPIWLMDVSHYLPNLIEIKLENLPRCSDLPPLGQLPNLDKLHLQRLKSITKIDRDFCGGEGAFLRLSKFTLYNMEQMEEWNTTYCGEDSTEEFMFPKLDTLEIANCPKLRLTPRPPIFRIWKIWNSDVVISSWSEGDHISHSPSDTPGTTLEVSSSKVPEGEWRLLHHLPTLQVLVIRGCYKLTSLPENTQHLAFLQSLKLDFCHGISALPEWLGQLTSLESLNIYGCRSIKSLPHCIQQLTKLKELRISCSRKLKKWCESDENKTKLAHIENIRYR